MLILAGHYTSINPGGWFNPFVPVVIIVEFELFVDGRVIAADDYAGLVLCGIWISTRMLEKNINDA